MTYYGKPNTGVDGIKHTPIREYIAKRIAKQMEEEESKLDKVEQERLDQVREEFYLK